ncbi:helix-turn-helix domain-containing protein [Streptomyces fradiae]|uniref:helix-turn-helix domain-containing protein n=1 Tax=Streptomyces fradiae TaxID=1906 RepID=UPI0039888E0B
MQRTIDPLWNSARVRSLVDRCDPGGLIRLGRVWRGWRQADLGRRLGCSASTVSRLEKSGRVGDLRLLQRAASEVGVPPDVLGAALGLTGARATRPCIESGSWAVNDHGSWVGEISRTSSGRCWSRCCRRARRRGDRRSGLGGS